MKIKASSHRHTGRAKAWLSASSGDVAFWVVGLGGFAYALARALAHAEYDLRTPPDLSQDRWLSYKTASSPECRKMLEA